VWGLLGGILGQIPWVAANVDTMLLLMLFAIALVSIVPLAGEVVRKRRRGNPAAPDAGTAYEMA
jgi:membrane-associated protein